MLKKFNHNKNFIILQKQIKTDKVRIDNDNFVLKTQIMQDMMFFIKIWRQVRGYSINGQRGHSNNNNNKKNKKLLFFRIQQFYKLFGKRKRDIFPTLVLAEYNNRLWFLMWHSLWLEARIFVFKLAIRGKGKVKFDPQILSKNIVTGIKRFTKKKKHNTAKRKIIMVATVGLPILFSLHLYGLNSDKNLPFSLNIPGESRRKMGKKKKITKKKKK